MAGLDGATFETLGGVIFYLLSFLKEKISFFDVEPAPSFVPSNIVFLLPIFFNCLEVRGSSLTAVLVSLIYEPIIYAAYILIRL